MSANRLPQSDHELADLLKALGHPVRLRIVELTSGEEKPVGEISARLNLPQAVTSQHLKVLRDCRLVNVRTQGNRRLYSVNVQRTRLIREFLNGLWTEGMDDLKRVAERQHRQERDME